MAKKTLAEQISELSKPVNPDFDIEDDERGLFDHKSGSEEESEAELETDDLRSEHYVKTEKSRLRDDGVNIKDAKYTGKHSSRKEIFDQESEEDEEEESEDEIISENNEIISEDDEEEQEKRVDESDSGISLKADSEDEEHSESELESESEAETDEEKEATSKRDKIKSLMASERKHIINRLSSSTQTDALKGYAVINQQRFFDSIIDSRIKIQKALTNSNILPLSNKVFDENKTEETEDKLRSAQDSIHSLLDSILSLRTKIFNKEKISKEPIKFKINKKRTFKEYNDETMKLDEILNKNRDLVLTKWSHKVQSASGASALNASKFKTINQSAAQQVESNLIDMDRLIKRTRMNRRNLKVIGATSEGTEDKESVGVDRSLQEDENIFDDEDFYRVLLNDLVDKKISESNPVNGLTIQLTKTKLKKNVDTKASKGRKIKYTVQEKIQNWEAPNGKFKWSDEQIDEFFAGLLGQKIDFDEDENEAESEAEENEDETLLRQDDLKIFG